MKKMYVVLSLMMLIFVSVANAQMTNTVTFKADVSALYENGWDPAVHTIKIEGLNWDNGDVAVTGTRDMVQSEDDTTIYVTTLEITSATNMAVGDTARWKYKTGPDDAFVNGGWEAGDPESGYDGRAFVFQADGSEFEVGPMQPRVEFILVGVGIQNTVTFQVDLSSIEGTGSGYFDYANGDFMEVRGFWGNDADPSIFSSKLVEGDIIMTPDPFAVGIYSTTLLIELDESGEVGDYTGFKFKGNPDDNFGNWGWEPTANRNYQFQEDGAEVTLDPIVPSVFPSKGDLENDLEVLWQLEIPSGAFNVYDGSLVPIEDVEFAFVKGMTVALGDWKNNGLWTVADTTASDSAGVALYDDGTHGDKVAGDNIYSNIVVFPAGITQGPVIYRYGAYYEGCEDVPGTEGSYLDNATLSGNESQFFIVQESDEMVEHLDTWPSVVTAVQDDFTPLTYSLEQNFPNPFNPETKIRYSIPKAGNVSLKVYNVLGSEVASIISGMQEVGSYEVTFNASHLASGIYFYSLTANDFTASKKMILIK